MNEFIGNLILAYIVWFFFTAIFVVFPLCTIKYMQEGLEYLFNVKVKNESGK